MTPKLTTTELDTAIRLLRKNSSLNAVSAFLKRRGLTHSAGSWEVMKDERLKPAVDAGKFDRADLLELLRNAEEFGRQHVFLFKCEKSEAGELTNEELLRKKLAPMKLVDLLDNPRIVEKVPGLQAVEIRLEQTKTGTYFVGKFVDVRKYMVQVSKETKGDEQVVTSRLQEDRAVNVIRIAPDGTTEVRVQSHRNALDYAAQAENVFAKLAGVTDRLKYGELSLGKARRYLLENATQLSSSIRVGAGTVRSKKGAPVTFAASHWGEGLFGANDEEVEAAMSALLAKGGGRSKCDVVNCIWLKRQGAVGPVSDTHTLIGGNNNEIVFVPQCDQADYLYVLEKIISFTK